MKPERLLSIISKQYLQMNKVNRYRMTKIEDMSDSELIRACHCYCEENNQVSDFEKYRTEEEAKYRYCNVLQEYVDEGHCIDIQMIGGGYIKKTALPDVDIDFSESESKCKECRYGF